VRLRRSQLPQLPWYKRIWDESQTKLLAAGQVISGGVLFTLNHINDWFNNDTVKGYLTELSLPKTVTIGLVAIGIITYIAHGHGDDA
jgi:hypothetical protein